jgi:apolipoprotein N-acyltransferase
MSMPSGFGILIFITFIPVFYVLDRIDKRKAFFYGLSGGILSGILIYRGFTGYGNIIYFYSVIFLAVEFSVFFYLYKTKGILSSFLWIPFFEFLRTVGPFACPSNIALCVYKIPGIVYYSSFAGIYGVSLIIILFNYFLYKLKYNYICILLLFFIIPLSFIYKEDSDKKNIDIAVIQGSIPIWMYSMEEFKVNYSEHIENVYLTLTRKASADNDIVIWPETAIHKSLLKKDYPYYREFFQALNNEYKTDFIIGTSHLEDGVETNSVFFLKENNEFRYDKIKTVPFVEDFYKKGNLYEPIGDDELKIAPIICFESAFENLVIRNTGVNADFIVVNTNDAGFNKTIISHLHAAYSVFRACENRKWLVRAAQSGISMFVSPYGVIKSQSSLFETQILSQNISLSNKSESTLFSDYYYYIIVLLIFLFIMSVVL